MILLKVKTSIDGYHHWPDAPDHREYLRTPHRHTFGVSCMVPVTEEDRELEFHDLCDKLHLAARSVAYYAKCGCVDYDAMSCEMIASKILEEMPGAKSVAVSEDHMSEAIVIVDEKEDSKRKVVTVCGSTRFKDATLEAIDMLEHRGHIALSVGSFMHADELEFPDEVKADLDALHKDKIRISDYVYVVNPNGYVGSSTKSEIQLARNLGLPVEFLFVRENDVNESVNDFAEYMKAKLHDNSHKSGWRDVYDHTLIVGLKDEIIELEEALEKGISNDIVYECADVANFAMMIADNRNRRQETE